jgi:hypothetical protein
VTPGQADEVVLLLRAIAVALKARVPRERRPMSEEELAGWRAVNRRPARGDDPGTPPDEFFARRDTGGV